eukprot:357367-Chlamydomonas_euryale.AAC.2
MQLPGLNRPCSCCGPPSGPADSAACMPPVCIMQLARPPSHTHPVPCAAPAAACERPAALATGSSSPAACPLSCEPEPEACCPAP